LPTKITTGPTAAHTKSEALTVQIGGVHYTAHNHLVFPMKQWPMHRR